MQRMRLIAQIMTPFQGVGLLSLFVWALSSVSLRVVFLRAQEFVSTPVPNAFAVAVTTVISGWCVRFKHCNATAVVFLRPLHSHVGQL